jgi:hypothetical protein
MTGKLVYSDGWYVEYEFVTTQGRIMKELPIRQTDNQLDLVADKKVSFDIDIEISLDKIKRYAKLKQ